MVKGYEDQHQSMIDVIKEHPFATLSCFGTGVIVVCGLGTMKGGNMRMTRDMMVLRVLGQAAVLGAFTVGGIKTIQKLK